MTTRRRQLRTPSRNVVATVDRRRIEPKTKQAFLALDYPGIAQSAFVQFSDPTFVRSNVLQARLRSGLGGIPLRAGTPVTVQISHGQVEIVSIPSGGGGGQSPNASDVALPADASPATATFGVEPLTELPDLPNDDYPPGSVVGLITDGKNYRNVDDDWEAVVESADMPDLSATIGLNSSGAVADPITGLIFLTGNTDPNLDNVGAQPILYNEWKRLVRNGDLHDPPPHPELPIDNDENKLPGWVINGSFITSPAYWVPDTATGSGGKIRVDAAIGCTTGLYQNVTVRSSATRNNSVVLIISGQAGHHTTSQIDGFVYGLDSTGAVLPTLISSLSNFSADNTLDDVVFTASAGIDAATEKLTVSMAVVASAADTVYITEAQLVEGPPVGVHPDIGDPTNAPATDIYDSGVWTLNGNSVVIPNLTGSPTFITITTTGDIELGHPSDTTLHRSSPGNVTIEGNLIYRAGGTDVPVTDGGTGSSTAAGARTNLGAYGSGDSPTFADIHGTTLDLGGATDATLARSGAGDLTIEGNVIYRAGGTDVPVTDGGTGSSTASGARTNLGAYGSGDSPTFATITTTGAIEVGNASDTTLARSTAGNLTIEGNLIYRAGGTDVPVADGGTGASTAAGAATNLGLGTGDSPQFAGVNLGSATATTLTGSAGVLSVEGNVVYMAGGTDVPVVDGGTGSSTASGARTNLGAYGSGDSPTFATITTTGDIQLGNASDTTLHRTGAGDFSVGGNGVYRVGGTDASVADGGTGASTAGGARTNLGLVIGTDVAAAGLITSSGLTIGTGTIAGRATGGTGAIEALTAAQGRSVLTLDTASTPEFRGITLNAGGVPTVAIALSSSTDITVAGNLVYRVGGTDAAIADGGTGASTASAAVDNLGGASATGTGGLVRKTSAALVTPDLGTPTAIVLTSATGLPLGGIVNIANNTILGNNTGGAAAPVALTVAQAQAVLQLQGKIQAARVTLASIAAGGTHVDTITWPSAFADTNYTVALALLQGNQTTHNATAVIASQATGSITVRTDNEDTAARTMTVHAIAIHD